MRRVLPLLAVALAAGGCGSHELTESEAIEAATNLSQSLATGGTATGRDVARHLYVYDGDVVSDQGAYRVFDVELVDAGDASPRFDRIDGDTAIVWLGSVRVIVRASGEAVVPSLVVPY